MWIHVDSSGCIEAHVYIARDCRSDLTTTTHIPTRQRMHTNMCDGINRSIFWDDFMMDGDDEDSQLDGQVSFNFEDDMNAMFELREDNEMEGNADSGEDSGEEPEEDSR